MNNVLITGATGFLGRLLCRDLVEKGHKVSILARKSSDLSSLQDLSIKVFYGDITNRLSLLQATGEQDVVYHLAGLIAYKRADRQMMEKINVDGTANVIDACITNKTKKLLHLSSVVTIGASPKPEPIDENFDYNLGSTDGQCWR